MSYIGRGTDSISNVEVLDNLTFDGSASYTLQKLSTNFVPSSANNLLISISGVVQQGNFSVSGSTITFDTTVSASDTCDWILHYGTGLITTVADGTITEAKLGSNAVTTAKINNGAITSAKLDSGLALGKIGQVVTVTKTNEFTTTSTSFVQATGTSVSITPSSTSSKILVLVSSSGGNTNSGAGTKFTIYRDATNLGTSDGIMFLRAANANDHGAISMSTLDSPSTTSSISYSIYIRVSAGTGYVGVGNIETSVTLMEVLA